MCVIYIFFLCTGLAFTLIAIVAITMTTSVHGTDLTREPETSGCEVVLACIDTILQTQIFPADKELLRRIAFVESKDGNDRNTYRAGYHGGIWQVRAGMIQLLDNSGVASGGTGGADCPTTRISPKNRENISLKIFL